MIVISGTGIDNLILLIVKKFKFSFSQALYITKKNCHFEGSLRIPCVPNFHVNCCQLMSLSYSMGGSVAVHIAAKRALSSLAGLVVVDVVEVWVLQNNYLSFVCDYLSMVA